MRKLKAPKFRAPLDLNFAQIPESRWAPGVFRLDGALPGEMWRSRDVLVQIYSENNGFRLSIHRTTMGPDGRWLDGLTWDDLQAIKSAVGFGEFWAVELFPADSAVVNVAAIRHLWTVKPPAFAWKLEASPAMPVRRRGGVTHG